MTLTRPLSQTSRAGKELWEGLTEIFGEISEEASNLSTPVADAKDKGFGNCCCEYFTFYSLVILLFGTSRHE